MSFRVEEEGSIALKILPLGYIEALRGYCNFTELTFSLNAENVTIWTYFQLTSWKESTVVFSYSSC